MNDDNKIKVIDHRSKPEDVTVVPNGLGREDVLSMLRGTNGPGAYIHPFGILGELKGFPNERWCWNDTFLATQSTEQLYNWYLEIQSFKQVERAKDWNGAY